MFNFARSTIMFAVGALALIAPAAARRPLVVTGHRVTSDLPTRTISYTDLNLARAEGARTLESRVRGAVFDVCADAGIQPFETGYGECQRTAWSGARPQMALAIQRAQEIATNGKSLLPIAAISIIVP